MQETDLDLGRREQGKFGPSLLGGEATSLRAWKDWFRAVKLLIGALMALKTQVDKWDRNCCK